MYSHFSCSKFSIFSSDRPNTILIHFVHYLLSVSTDKEEESFLMSMMMAARNAMLVYQTNPFIHLFFASNGCTNDDVKAYGCRETQRSFESVQGYLYMSLSFLL